MPPLFLRTIPRPCRIQQPLIDQYVSKYTPDHGMLSTPSGSSVEILRALLLYYLLLGSFNFRGYNWVVQSETGVKALGFRIFTGILRRCSMFESLSERIREDERGTVNNTQRTLFWIAVFVVVAAGLFFGIKLFSA